MTLLARAQFTRLPFFNGCNMRSELLKSAIFVTGVDICKWFFFSKMKLFCLDFKYKLSWTKKEWEQLDNTVNIIKFSTVFRSSSMSS